MYTGDIISATDSATFVPSLTEGTLLAKSNAKQEVEEDAGNWRHVGTTVIDSGEERTKVVIRGNRVIVPVTLEYGNSEVTAELLLDTGATGTAINTDIADQLSINLSKVRKTLVQVVGGAVIESSVVRIRNLTVGPHTKRNWNIFVVPHNGPSAQFDGLLGMDVLRGLKYRIDFKNQFIIWE
ncbi:MAG: clan AA aspartic protease [Syntrophaceae bacterium]|nr:clan AA aspartic protease [Syntrophaceae bacterium]